MFLAMGGGSGIANVLESGASSIIGERLSYALRSMCYNTFIFIITLTFFFFVVVR